MRYRKVCRFEPDLERHLRLSTPGDGLRHLLPLGDRQELDAPGRVTRHEWLVSGTDPKGRIALPCGFTHVAVPILNNLSDGLYR
jgi:hypothetical protein